MVFLLRRFVGLPKNRQRMTEEKEEEEEDQSEFTNVIRSMM
jgi:hypothetical protein